MIIRKFKKLPCRFDPGAEMLSVQTVGEAEMRLSDGSKLLRMVRGDETLYSKGPPGADMHPWFTTPVWFDEISVAPPVTGAGRRGGSAEPSVCVPAGWYAMVEPGFVNGLDPLVYGAPEIKIEAGGQPSPETAYQFGKFTTNSSKEKRIPGLLDRPRVPLNGFRPYTKPVGPVVEYFKKFGFEPSSKVSANKNSANSNSKSKGKSPWLGFCDIYLATARASYELEVGVGAFPVTAIEYTITYNDESLQRYGTRARLMTGEMPVKPSQQDRIAARALGKPLDDDGLDYKLISTIYVLKAGEWGGDPDSVVLNGQNETAYIQHHCFWNLEHRAKNRNPLNLPALNAGLLLLPLIGRYGVAPVLSVSALESALLAVISAALTEGENSGLYWSV